MQGFRGDSPFARLAAEALGDEAFRVVDVGGLDHWRPGWRAFGERLALLAVTPGAPAPATAAVRFAQHPLAVDPAVPAWKSTWPLLRLSAHRANLLREARSQGREPEPLAGWVRGLAEAPLPTAAPACLDYASPFGHGDANGLGALIEVEGFGQADFLNLGAGDADFQLLAGLSGLLEQPGLLGVAVRARLFGSADAQDNSLHNMDRLLRAKGFEPYALHPLTYSAAALPYPFMDKHPDAAQGGRMVAADALYLRDLAQPERQGLAAGLGDGALLKAAALLALFNLPDQAAELLLVHSDRLGARIDLEHGLDLLALQVQEDHGSTLPYADYIAAFEREDPFFFDIYSRRAAWMERLTRTAREAPARIACLEGLARDLLSAQRRPSPPTLEALTADTRRRSRLHPEHHWVFDHFERFRGDAPGRAYVDYIGARTSADFVDFGAPTDIPPGATYEPPFPTFDEEYFEWQDILQAALEAGPTFTMLELGAGYGRWSARGAIAARQLGKAVRIGLAEAEPRHQGWLRRHMETNGVAAADFRVYPWAIGGSAGEAVFVVGAPPGMESENWFGQAVMPLDPHGCPVIGDYHGTPMRLSPEGWRFIVVEQQPLSRVLADYDRIDIADFDLQGAETDAVREGLDALNQKVRRLHIGTHGPQIEADLRQILSGAGWLCVRDYAVHSQNDTPFGRFAFVDGVQTWVNPRLA